MCVSLVKTEVSKEDRMVVRKKIKTIEMDRSFVNHIFKIKQAVKHSPLTMYIHNQDKKGAGRTLLTLALNNQDKLNAVDNTDIIIAYDGDERDWGPLIQA